MRVAALALLACVTCAAMCAESTGTLALDDLRIRSERGDREATRALAEAFYLGRGGVEQDFPEAARWYRKLAAQGDPRAQTSLGLMYARGLGFPRNMVEARRWWSLAAAQNDAGAQYNLATVYFEGNGTTVDLPQAHFWFSRAAARGHVLAQTNLGVMLFKGHGIARDEVAGLAWLMVAAANGEEKARELLKTFTAEVPGETVDRAHERVKQIQPKPPR